MRGMQKKSCPWTAAAALGYINNEKCQYLYHFHQLHRRLHSNGKYCINPIMRHLNDWPSQGGSDKVLGSIMLLVALAVFIYYTVWAILLVSPNL